RIRDFKRFNPDDGGVVLTFKVAIPPGIAELGLTAGSPVSIEPIIFFFKESEKSLSFIFSVLPRIHFFLCLETLGNPRGNVRTSSGHFSIQREACSPPPNPMRTDSRAIRATRHGGIRVTMKLREQVGEGFRKTSAKVAARAMAPLIATGTQ